MNRLHEDRAPFPPAAGNAPQGGSRAAGSDSPAGSALAAIRRRHDHEPIVPEYHPSAGERLRAAFRSHKREIAAISALVVALVLGIVGTSMGMLRAARQRDAALAATAEADRLRTVAETGRREAAAVSEFLEAVLGSVNPWGADQSAEVSVEQMLDTAAAKLDAGSLAGQKEAEARVRGTLGHAYAGLAASRRAEAQYRKSLELYLAIHGGRDHPDVARTMNALASALVALGPARTKEAEDLATASLDMRRRLWGGDHKEVADSLDTLSAVCRVKRDFFTAERRVDEALAMRRRLPGDAHSKHGLASSLTNKAVLKWRKGELTATIDHLREAMGLYAGTLPADHLLRGALHLRLGNAFNSAGKRADAIREFRQSVDVRRRHRPEAHVEIAEPFRRAALLMVEEGQFADAEAFLLDRESRLRAVPDCPPEPRSELYGHFVCLYQAWGKPEKIGPWSKRLQESLEQEIAAATAAIDADPKAARPYVTRARLRIRAGQFKPAREDFDRALVLDGKDHWVWFHQGCLLAFLGDEPAYREHCKKMLDRFGTSPDERILDCTVKTCSLIPGAGGDPAALDRIASGVWSTGSKDERNASWFRLMKGMSQYRAAAYDAAVNWLTDALVPDLAHRTATAESLLAMTYQRLGKPAEAAKFLKRAEDRAQRLTPRPGVGDLAEAGIENWLVCQVALREARAVVGK